MAKNTSMSLGDHFASFINAQVESARTTSLAEP